MSKKQDFLEAVNMQQPENAVPIWELHFHLWETMSGERFISGTDFVALSSNKKKDDALKRDADIICKVAEDLHFNAVSIPDRPWNCPYTLPMEDRLKLAALLRKVNPDFYVVAGGGANMGMPSNFDGYEEFCYMLFDDPKKIDEMAKNRFINGMDNLQRYSNAGIEATYSGADYADTRAPFFTQSQMERFVLPYLTKWVERCKELNIIPIQHTDGNVMPLLEQIIGSGVMAMQAVDPTAGMDMKTTKEAVQGRMCICGNIDNGVLILESPEFVYNEAAKILNECKDGGGIILGASNAVVMETPKENYVAVIEAWKDFGQY